MRRFVLLVAAFVAVTLLCAPSAFAQDPLKVVLVDVSKKGGQRVYKTFDGLLDASDDIQTRSSKKFLDRADEEGLDEADLRKGKTRDRSAKKFRAIMKDIDAEAILLLDVFSKGRKAQMVVIGPNGKEAADVRRNIKKGRIKKDDAKKVLGEAFGSVVPLVKDFRDNGGWDAVEEEEEEEEVADNEEEEEEEEEDEEMSLKDKAVANKRSDSALDTGFSLGFGALLGSRSFTMESADAEADEGFQLDHSSPFVGVWVKVDTIFATLGDGDAAIGATLFGGYAPFTTVFDEADEFASDYARLGLELKYIKVFGDSFILDVYGGAEASSITIEKNRFYTGNRYIAARAGLYGSYVAGRLAVGAGGGVLPTFSILNSDGAFGDAGFSLGFEANAGLSFLITDSIDLGLAYDLTLLGVEYEEPVVVADPLTSSDTMHTVRVLVGYRL